MKKLIAIALLFTSCTDNQRVKDFGGLATINLPAGQKLMHMVSNSELKSGFTAAPTWSQVLRWLDGNMEQLEADVLTKLHNKLQQQQ